MQKADSLALDGRHGSVRVAAVVDTPENQRAIMDTMRDFVSDVLEGSGPALLTSVQSFYPEPEHADNS
jgi:hypothetical protein